MAGAAVAGTVNAAGQAAAQGGAQLGTTANGAIAATAADAPSDRNTGSGQTDSGRAPAGGARHAPHHGAGGPASLLGSVAPQGSAGGSAGSSGSLDSDLPDTMSAANGQQADAAQARHAKPSAHGHAQARAAASGPGGADAHGQASVTGGGDASVEH